MALSFETDIKPLFRPKDIQAMKAFGNFDLSKYDDVKANAGDIHERVKSRTMPCDTAGKWPPARVALFKQWIDDEMLP